MTFPNVNSLKSKDMFHPVFNSIWLYAFSHLNLKVTTSSILRLQYSLYLLVRKMAGAQLLQIWLLTALEWEVELVAPSVKTNKNQQRRFHGSYQCISFISMIRVDQV